MRLINFLISLLFVLCFSHSAFAVDDFCDANPSDSGCPGAGLIQGKVGLPGHDGDCCEVQKACTDMDLSGGSNFSDGCDPDKFAAAQSAAGIKSGIRLPTGKDEKTN